MNEDWITQLRDVLRDDFRHIVREELAPITQEVAALKQQVDGMRTELTSVKQQVDGMRTELTSVKQQVDGIQLDLASFKEQVGAEFAAVRQQLDRIELHQNDDVLGMLSHVQTKLELCATKEEVSALARIQGEQQLRIELLRKAQ
ncbi:hypothetical protein [Paenibacillus sp. YYML68]|uniref:hypothetical protein n=1 Tax=Paenibacillus sp. YYML68 TaxID=2909250 RepID=UPI00249063DD|nr:hypothetical protein [Paenibacillus sp. YYML68]